MTASEQLAAFAAGLDPRGLDTPLVDKIKDHLLDAVGVACAGLSDPQARAAAQVALRWGGAPDAGLIGYGARLPAPKAAFVNTLHARILTFDDTYEAGPAHPGSAIVCAVLATAERIGASGHTVLAALVAGYEVATRVAASFGSAHYTAGFHSTGTCVPFGAAAAAARVLGLDAAQIAGALGLAGEAAIGLRQYQEDGSMLDSALNAARGAELGVAAAEMAASGLAGPRGVLDGRWGVLRMLSSASRPEKLLDGLGRHWEFAATALKPYASCRFTHGPVGVLRQAGLDAADIDAVEIAAFRESCEVSDRPNPRSRAETILSHQVAAALALTGRRLMPADYDRLDPSVTALAAQVRVIHDPELDKCYPAQWPHRITIRMRGGRVVTLVSDVAPAATHEEAQAKFRALADPVLGPTHAQQLSDQVAALETVADIRALVRLMTRPAREAA